MSDLDFYAAGAVVLLGLAFCLVRNLPAFVIVGTAIAGVTAGVTFRAAPIDRLFVWTLLVAALAAWIAGLAIVKVMLVRSISLRLLAQLDGRDVPSFDTNLHARLDDLRRYRLVRSTERGNEPTAFGRLIAAIVATSYRAAGVAA